MIPSDRAEPFPTVATVARLCEAAAAVARTARQASSARGGDGNAAIAGLWNLDSLQRLQDMLADLTGSSSIIIDTDSRLITRPSNFNEVCLLVQQTAKGRECCEISDQERSSKARSTDSPVYHMCQSCGFLDGSVPIILNGQRLGYWLVGQCNALGVSREDIAVHARTIGADVVATLNAYDRTEPMSVDEFERILELHHTVVNELTSRTVTFRD